MRDLNIKFDWFVSTAVFFAVVGSDGDSFDAVVVNELLIGIGESYDIELPLDDKTIILR